MKRWPWSGVVVSLALAVGMSTAHAQSTEQRLELLERRASLITDLTLQLDQLKTENRALRGAVENLTFEIEQLKRKQRDLYLDIDQRIGSLQGGSAPAPVMPAAIAQSPEAKPAAPVEAPNHPASYRCAGRCRDRDLAACV